MADVLIVCVREDEPQAKALAEMFEAAGFSIGGAPSSDGALRSSGAGVIVWSQASIRSRPFLDASQRVINAGKAVVASLIEPPPPSSIGDSQAFDLSEWDGDPNDPSLDPLFFAVDRMVNAARAAVGATSAPAADEPAYEPPPPPRTPRKSAPPQQSYRPAPASPSGGDALGAEAEFWRAIRDSRNPADFMDYLARFGPNGAFSEVAELRLKQLTGSSERIERAERPAAQRMPPRAGALPSSRPVVRSEAPAPRIVEPPPRRMEPPAAPRRAEAAPTPRRAPTERTYDRFEDREPPRGEGGALRAFILVALLGAALAGGLYVGGGLDFGDKSGNTPESAETAAAPPGTGDEPASADALEPESYSLSDATDVSREIAAAPARREPQQSPQQARPRDTRPAPTQQASTAASQQDGPPPAPVTSWGTGGPLSLTTPSSQPASGAASPPSSSVVPLTTPPQTQQPQQQIASVEPMIGSPPPQTRPAGSVAWSQRPSARRISELYPDRAVREGAGGRVQLDCVVQANLSVACTIVSETPAGLGFGRAAIAAATSYRAQAALTDGSSAIGARTRISFNFQPPQ